MWRIFNPSQAIWILNDLSYQHLTLSETDAFKEALNGDIFGRSKWGDGRYISKLFPLARPACQFTPPCSAPEEISPRASALLQRGPEPRSLGHVLSFLQPQHPQYDLNQPTGWLLPVKSWDTRNATPGHACLIAYSTTGWRFSFYLWLNLLTSVGKACYLSIIRPLHSLSYNRYWTVCCHPLFFCWLKIRHAFTTSTFALPRNPVCPVSTRRAW